MKAYGDTRQWRNAPPGIGQPTSKLELVHGSIYSLFEKGGGGFIVSPDRQAVVRFHDWAVPDSVHLREGSVISFVPAWRDGVETATEIRLWLKPDVVKKHARRVPAVLPERFWNVPGAFPECS